jgi:3-oxoacyl-[acyl-carrier protein] reductase
MNSKVVLITGASRGIGREIALAFGRAGGYRVMINCVKETAKAQAVAKEIAADGGSARVFAADITDAAAVKNMVRRITDEEGSIDILVNNAAVIRDNLLLRMSADEWDTVLKTDLTGTFQVLQTCARVMMKKHDGAIINIASIVAGRGSFGGANYASAKAGLVALTKSAARELGRFSIRVNAVMPGFQLTDMGKQAPAEYAENVKKESVLSCTTDLKELAAFIVFLSGMKTVSGQIFNWDSRIP